MSYAQRNWVWSRIHLLHPFPVQRSAGALSPGKLPDDFPDYLVFVTRHSLLAFTTSLTDISGEVHSFFVKLNYAFAMDRMMRSFMLWRMPGAAGRRRLWPYCNPGFRRPCRHS